MVGTPSEDVAHGLRRRWLDVPGTVTGALTFGVGAADEPPHLVGITHLAEHLVFQAMGGLRPRANGVTGVDTVTFLASGTRAEVVTFLTDLAAALRDPRITDEDVRRELPVVRAERPDLVQCGPGLLTARFGLGGPGNVNAGWPALPAITAAEVREWLGRWCVADNAVLTLTTPPDDLDLVLPRGAGPVRTVPQPQVRVPTLLQSPRPGVAVSLLVPAVHADLLERAVVDALVGEVRMRRGLVYSVDSVSTPVGPDAAQVDLVLDPLEADVSATVESVVTTLRRIAAEGFPEQVLGELVAGVEADRGWWDDPVHQLRPWAEAYLLGRALPPSAEEEVARARATTPETLRTVLAAALETLVVAHDECADLGPAVAALGLEVEDGLPFREHGRGVPPGVRMRRRSAPRELVGLDGQHVWASVDGEVRRIALADVAVVVRGADEAVTFVDRHGRAWTTRPDDWKRDGRAALEEIVAGARAAQVRDGVWPGRAVPTFAERRERRGRRGRS